MLFLWPYSELRRLTLEVGLFSAGGSGIHRPVDSGSKPKRGKNLAPGEEFKAKVRMSSFVICQVLFSFVCFSLNTVLRTKRKHLLID